MSRLTVGIPGYRSESGVFGVGSNYLEWVDKLIGNPRIILPWEEKVKVDLLLLPGGPDLNPNSYNEIPSFKTNETCPFRQHFFDNRLNWYIGQIPIFGICLGFQQLLVKLGAKIIQDLPFHPTSDDRWEEGHGLTYNPEMLKLLGFKPPKDFQINSHHHQGVILTSDISPSTIEDPAVAWYSDPCHGNVLEAFLNREKKVAGVQWHPEEFYDQLSYKLVQQILK